MQKKTLAIGFILVAAPLCLSAAQWSSDSSPQTKQRMQQEIDELTDTIELLEARLEETRRQIEESLDMLEASTEPRRDRNCTPNRNSLVYFQWFDQNGHTPRADRMIAKWIDRYGKRKSRLIESAWSLMTERSTIGKFDRAALRLAEHAIKGDDDPEHRALDVLALAKFLDGQVDAAIELEQQAVAADDDRSDYRRRLRMYEAARRVASTSSVATPKIVAKAPDLAVAAIVADETDPDEKD